LTALALSAFDGAIHDGKSLGSANIILEPETSRPVYLITATTNITMTSTSVLVPEQAKEAVKLARALLVAPKNLRHIPRLLAQSNENRLQSLNAFISAWAGLEILIAATFQQYEESWTTSINGGLPTSALNVANRIRTIMKDKYRLTDKFAIMASALDPQNADQDIIDFSNLKKIRDEFFHALSTDPESLPGETARRLLRKYLSLHLQKSGEG
jgi:citrate synthase